MNAILLKHNSIRSYLLSSITSGSLRFYSFLLSSPKYQLSLISPSNFFSFSIRHGHSSKPFGHARSILNILSKKPPNPNMLSSSSALPSPINIDHKLPSLQEKSPPNISSSSLPTNSSAYSDNKLPVLNSTTSRKHLNDLIPSSVNPIKTTSNSIPSTVQQQGLGNALITAGSNLFFSDKYAKPKSSSVVVHQAPKDLTPEQLHIRHKQETIIVNVDILKRMPAEEVYNDKYLLDQYKILINNSPHFVLNRQGQMFMELCYSRRVFPQELVGLYSQFKINDIIGKNNNMVEITTFFNVLAIETIASRYPEIARLLNIQIIPTCIPSHNLKTISHNAESLLYMNNSVKYTKNSTSDLLYNNKNSHDP